MARYALLLALASVGCCLTPMLPGLIRTTLFYQNGGLMVAESGIAELRPFYAGPMGWLSASIVAGGYLACWNGRARLRVAEWFWLIGGTILLFRMGRFSPVFVIIAAPIVAAAMPTMHGATLGKPAIRLALASVAVCRRRPNHRRIPPTAQCRLISGSIATAPMLQVILVARRRLSRRT